MEYLNIESKVVPSLDELWDIYYRAKDLTEQLIKLDHVKNPSTNSHSTSSIVQTTKSLPKMDQNPSDRVQKHLSEPQLMKSSLTPHPKPNEPLSPSRKNVKISSPKNGYMKLKYHQMQSSILSASSLPRLTKNMELSLPPAKSSVSVKSESTENTGKRHSLSLRSTKTSEQQNEQNEQNKQNEKGSTRLSILDTLSLDNQNGDKKQNESPSPSNELRYLRFSTSSMLSSASPLQGNSVSNHHSVLSNDHESDFNEFELSAAEELPHRIGKNTVVKNLESSGDFDKPIDDNDETNNIKDVNTENIEENNQNTSSDIPHIISEEAIRNTDQNEANNSSIEVSTVLNHETIPTSTSNDSLPDSINTNKSIDTPQNLNSNPMEPPSSPTTNKVIEDPFIIEEDKRVMAHFTEIHNQEIKDDEIVNQIVKESSPIEHNPTTTKETNITLDEHSNDPLGNENSLTDYHTVLNNAKLNRIEEEHEQTKELDAELQLYKHNSFSKVLSTITMPETNVEHTDKPFVEEKNTSQSESSPVSSIIKPSQLVSGQLPDFLKRS